MKLNFRLSDINPSSDMDSEPSLPRNWYKCVIIREQLQRNNKMNGSYLQFTLKVVEGEYRGAEVSDNLNVDNPNPIAVKIAGQKLAAYSWVTLGHANEIETMNFQDKPFFAEIGPQKDSSKYTKVYALKDVNGKDPGQQGPAQQQVQQPTNPFAPQVQPQYAQTAASPSFSAPVTTSHFNGGTVPNAPAPPAFAPQQSQAFAAPSGFAPAAPSQRSSEPPPWATGKK